MLNPIGAGAPPLLGHFLEQGDEVGKRFRPLGSPTPAALLRSGFDQADRVLEACTLAPGAEVGVAVEPGKRSIEPLPPLEVQEGSRIAKVRLERREKRRPGRRDALQL